LNIGGLKGCSSHFIKSPGRLFAILMVSICKNEKHQPLHLSFLLSIVRNKSTMTTISTDNNFLTLINVFTVDPSNQQKLVDLLILATEGSVSKVAGFISSSLHKSIDGTKVTMYAQWRSMEDYQKMRNNPIASPYLQQALAIAKFEPGMYEVVKTFLPVT
jgi:quinol monooxygenase YgiN